MARIGECHWPGTRPSGPVAVLAGSVCLVDNEREQTRLTARLQGPVTLIEQGMGTRLFRINDPQNWLLGRLSGLERPGRPRVAAMRTPSC